MLALYHVRYLLGGTEKEVRETYISCSSTGDGEARKACPRDLFTVPVSEVSETRCDDLPHPMPLVRTFFRVLSCLSCRRSHGLPRGLTDE